MIFSQERFHFLLGDEMRRYALKHPDWTLRFGELAPADVHGLNLDALVVYFRDNSLLSAFQSLGLPMIAMYWRPDGFTGPVIVQDNAEIARLAADYFASHGIRQFGFVRWSRWVDPNSGQMKLGDEVNFSELQRQSAFLDEARRRHIPCSISPDYARDSEVWQAPLSRWIAGLPKPAGLLCVSDSVGGTVLESCYLQNLSVPEQVSVLGVDNDEKLCTLFHPPLSSISVSLDSMAERIGTLLETAFRTGSMPSGTFPIKPSGIVERETTGRVFLEDPMVAQAFRTLRHHAFEPVNIKELFADTRYTRRQFDHRFRMLVGRTPFEELCRLRVERAKQHLRETRRPLAEIATVCGFSGTTQMRRVFMTVVGAPPQHFRSIQ